MPTVDGYAFPADRWYDPREHLWVRPEPGDDPAQPVVTIGVDALGQELLGDVVHAELGEPGTVVARGEALGSLEAEKMVRPVLAPVTGTLLEVNAAVLSAPRLLNQEPYEAGWLLRLRATRWAEERRALLHGEAAVGAWARAAVAAARAEA